MRSVWKVAVVLIVLGLVAFGLAEHRTNAPSPAIGGPPITDGIVSASAMVAAACGGTCAASPPSMTAGYEPLAAFGPDSSSGVVEFDHRPLEVCFAVGSLSVGKLTYVIGSPVGGPMTLFDDIDPDATTMQGCVFDPGSDSGPNTVSIVASGPGPWVVRIDQQD
ncbi:MAG TPA: hypothetical protein VED84_02370 [Acidimicrobiales bacterium]|nr:hypothetical protein [Acidimicrobiales bacterium]